MEQYNAIQDILADAQANIGWELKTYTKNWALLISTQLDSVPADMSVSEVLADVLDSASQLHEVVTHATNDSKFLEKIIELVSERLHCEPGPKMIRMFNFIAFAYYEETKGGLPSVRFNWDFITQAPSAMLAVREIRKTIKNEYNFSNAAVCLWEFPAMKRYVVDQDEHMESIEAVGIDLIKAVDYSDWE